MKARDNGLSASEIIALERGGTIKESLNVHDTTNIMYEKHRDVAVALDICYPEPHELVVYDVDGNVEYTLSKQDVSMLREQMRQMLCGGNK